MQYRFSKCDFDTDTNEQGEGLMNKQIGWQTDKQAER